MGRVIPRRLRPFALVSSAWGNRESRWLRFDVLTHIRVGGHPIRVRVNEVVIAHTNVAFLAEKFRIPVCLPAFRTPSVVRYPHVRCGGIPSPTGIVRHGERGTNGGRKTQHRGNSNELRLLRLRGKRPFKNAAAPLVRKGSVDLEPSLSQMA